MWAISQRQNSINEPRDILLEFANNEFEKFDGFATASNEDVRSTRKHREVPAVDIYQRNPLHTHSSILDDRTFAPPPPLPTQDNLVRFDFMAERQANTSLLPSFEKVMHSGKVLSRISITSLITKKWKEMFWIIYGINCFIVFRSKKDYEEWLLNPYLSEAERKLLIKLKVDFEKDLSVTGVRGYKTTEVSMKQYRVCGVL